MLRCSGSRHGAAIRAFGYNTRNDLLKIVGVFVCASSNFAGAFGYNTRNDLLKVVSVIIGGSAHIASADVGEEMESFGAGFCELLSYGPAMVLSSEIVSRRRDVRLEKRRFCVRKLRHLRLSGVTQGPPLLPGF